jgi:2-dehydro-3-deoxygluconokinase
MTAPNGARPVLVTFGEIMGLISTTSIGTLDVARDATIGIGGAEGNVAIGAARLGVSARWTGRVGRDAMGDLVERRLRSDGVDARVVRDEAFTGLMVRHRRTAGAVHVDYHRSGSAGSRLCPEDGVATGITARDLLHVTGITPALSVSAREACFAAVEDARAAGAAVSLDVNYRSKLWAPDVARALLADLAGRCDVLFAGVDEAALVLCSAEADARVLVTELARLGPREVIVKDGARGCAAVIDGDELVVPAPPVPEVDPVGAGDAFVAGYLAERLAGEPPSVRLRTATAMGAYAVTVPGDCELLPTRVELAEAHLVDVVR